MFLWKREYGAGVISYRLYLLGNCTNSFIMRKHGKSGVWMGRVGTIEVCSDPSLGQVKANLEILVEVAYQYQLDREWIERATASWSKARFGEGSSRQRACNEFGYILGNLSELEDELASILGKRPEDEPYPGWENRQAVANTAYRIREMLSPFGLD